MTADMKVPKASHAGAKHVSDPDRPPDHARPCAHRRAVRYVLAEVGLRSWWLRFADALQITLMLGPWCAGSLQPHPCRRLSGPAELESCMNTSPYADADWEARDWIACHRHLSMAILNTAHTPLSTIDQVSQHAVEILRMPVLTPSSLEQQLRAGLPFLRYLPVIPADSSSTQLGSVWCRGSRRAPLMPWQQL
jgi:hypothetical protein